LLLFGGFPEPFTKQEKRFLARWRRERRHRVVMQDVQDLSTLKEITRIELLADMLPSKVGSILSIRSIQEDLEVSLNTVTHWIHFLELVYYCYRILPYGPPKIRAVKKANKLYLWDWSEVEVPGARFENMVASHLLKFCHFHEDVNRDRMELRYLRDTTGREIDFVVLKYKKPLFAVECKTGERSISKHMIYFQKRTKIPVFYQVHLQSKAYQQNNIHVIPFHRFCKLMGI